MSQLNKLYRNFIILQEDERGYSSSNDKTLSGYSKIEAKGEVCKISFYAQNLRKDDEEYCILAICNKKDIKKILNLGKIPVSDTGKAEVTKEYPLDNIGGLGVSYDKISGAAIGKVKNGIPIIVMCGLINGDQQSDNWKNYNMLDCSHNKSKNKIEHIKKEEKKKKNKHREEEIDTEEEIDSFEEVVQLEEGIEINKDDNRNEENISDESGKEDTEEDIDEVINEETNREEIEINDTDTRNDVEEDKNNPFEKQDYNKNPFNNIEESLYGIEDLNRGYLKNKFDEYEEKLEEENSEFKIRGSVGEYFESIASGFEHCRNKYNEIKFCKWYKISVNDLHEMCNMSNYNRYAVAYYPMLNYYPYIRKYKHFMLGYKCDEEGNLRYIVYGIPGEKSKDEQPYEGKTGFVTWVDDDSRDGIGCWLMFYDFKNSTVVVPMK